MPGPSVSDAEDARRLKIIQKHMRPNGAPNIAAAAKAMKLSRSTVDAWWRDRDARPSPTAEYHGSLTGKMDAAAWRARLRQAEAQWHRERQILEKLAGAAGMPVEPADWLARRSGGPQAQAAAGALVTDIHYGEVVNADEIGGVNAYSPKIARERIERYFDGMASRCAAWGADAKIAGALVVIGGDLVSGDIHEELRLSNDGATQEHCFEVARHLAGGLKRIADHFGKCHAVFVPGNHGRTTIKPFAKHYARLSWDTVVAKMAHEALAKNRRLTWQIPNARDARIPVFGRSIFATHGDALGTGGGQGFAGPILPIARGGKKVALQQFANGTPYDLLLHGHFHHSANAPGTLSNGSFVGYGEYAHGLRMNPEPPQQWAFLLHEKWWLRDRAEVQLVEPRRPAGPSVL